MLGPRAQRSPKSRGSVPCSHRPETRSRDWPRAAPPRREAAARQLSAEPRPANGMGAASCGRSSASASASAWTAARTRSSRACDSAGRATRAGGWGPSLIPRTRRGNDVETTGDAASGTGASAAGASWTETSAPRAWGPGLGDSAAGGSRGGAMKAEPVVAGPTAAGESEDACPIVAPRRLGRRTHTFEERLRQDRPCYPRRRTQPLTLAPHPLRQGDRTLEGRWLLITAFLGRDFCLFPLRRRLGQGGLPLYLRRTPRPRWHLAAFSHTARPPGARRGAPSCGTAEHTAS